MKQDVYHVVDYVRGGDVVVDAGAYIGAFALFVKNVCPGATVICLEPVPGNFAILRANVGQEAIAEQVALVGVPGLVTVYDFGLDASGCHSIYDLGIDGAVPVEVEGVTLVQVLHKHNVGHLRFLKMDCQGAEFDVVPNTPHDALLTIDYIAMEVHRIIASTDRILGTIPDHRVKMNRMYRHLLRTHVPVRGNVERDSVQLWANRRLVDKITAYWLTLKYWVLSILYGVLRSTWSGLRRASTRR